MEDGSSDIGGLGMGSSTSSSSGRIPVFVFPSSLLFSGNERDHIKQILTIYNPYEFPVIFRVLSTTPNYYTVVEPEGSIQTKNCVDLIVRLTSSVPFDSPHPIESKFRVQVFHYNTRQPMGRKDVPSTIVFGSSQQGSLLTESASGCTTSAMFGLTGTSDVFLPTGQQGGPSSGGSQHGGRTQAARLRPEPQPGPQINYVAIVTGLVCILGLMLPSEKDDPGSTIIPPYLHLTVNQKLLVAYTLGLVTMVIFRP